MTLIRELGRQRQRQEDGEFEDSIGYILCSIAI